MTNFSLDPILELVENKMGLKPNSVNTLVWESVLKERMSHIGVSSYKDYLHKLQNSSHELQELIELLIVPETWFFRDRAAFDLLSKLVKNMWLNKSFGTPIKILSFPCSTGEEPYSIAMALLDAGLTKNQFKVDAADISKKLLAKAEVAIYGNNSFRGKDLSYRDRYFNKVERGYVLKEEVKDFVKFYYANILEKRLPFELHSYSFIFCRNLFIYLDAYAQGEALKTIERLLTPKGVIFVGPAETQLLRTSGFLPKPHARAYAFYRESEEAPKENTSLKSSLSHSSKSHAPSQNVQPILNSKAAFKELKDLSDGIGVEQKQDEKTILMQEAVKLADSGCFEEATNLCLRYINHFGAHFHIYFLLGLMQHAVGHEERAEEFFHKTVYLEPSHYEALVYLALLYEKKGDFKKAELFRNRAQKIHQIRS